MKFIDENTALLVIDVQERLVPAIYEKETMLLNTLKCIKASALIGIPLFYTEQYPKGLGITVAELRKDLDDAAVFEKTDFSCCASQGLMKQLKKNKVKKVLLCGIEAHVCVFQTAKDLLEKDFEVIVVADAVSSRQSVDKEWALKNLSQMGATVSTFECLFMEYLKGSKHSMFKEMSAILKL
ncbi:MAG: isochorismatase family protein [Lentisphaeraceae bacterium]|nr:isochorismatase family protein [Lentisphaeraceae bacterium]